MARSLIIVLSALFAASVFAQERGDHFFEENMARDMFDAEDAPRVYGRTGEEPSSELRREPTPEPTPEPERGELEGRSDF